ncbi:MAG: hypothetical protein EDR02_15090 [Actinobacteria bacterium]|nr:MAG: hypothetical protein EDR02_15090 [Actinomycetota bacterium]RIK04370.1 MAG: hypothetical protein DCC48_13390 [Acidobacteriota bacterium]
MVHRQARSGLLVAAAFAIGAALAAVLPHQTGAWLPLHLFLVGTVLSSISAVAPMLAVAWSAAPPPSDAIVRLQRVLLLLGTLGVAFGREFDRGVLLIALSGTAVACSLGLLAVLLARIRRHAVVARFNPAIDGYLLAVAFGLVGSGLGVALGGGASGGGIRAAHLTANLLGLVGLVIAATLPYMTATQIRSKMARRATPAALRATTAAMASAVAVAVVSLTLGQTLLATTGYLLYAAGILATVALCPIPRMRQLRWAGPRLVLLGTGVLWWAGGVVAIATSTVSGPGASTRLVSALVIGGYGQILAGSVAYLAPVLRGGGHARLGQGFQITRSPVVVLAANVAAFGALFGSPLTVAAGIGVWLADSALRATRLMTSSRNARQQQ